VALLDEISVRNTLIDDEIWVNLTDLANFLMGSVKEFAEKVFAESVVRPLSPSEAMLFKGVAEGMLNVVTLLSQGGMEAEINKKINTVQDLINTLERNSSNDK
jgi:hypothetical protein